MSKAVILILLSTNIAWSSDERSILRSIEKINEKSITNENCCEAFGLDQERLLNECVKNICGEDNWQGTHARRYQEVSSLAVRNQRTIPENIQKLLNELQTKASPKESQKERQEIADVIAKIKEGDKVNEALLPFFALFEAFVYFPHFDIDYKVENGEVKAKTKREETERALAFLPREKRVNIIDTIDFFLASAYKGRTSEADSIPPEILIKALWKTNTEAGFNLEWDLASKNMEFVKTVPKIFSEAFGATLDEGDLVLLKTKITDKSLTETDARSLIAFNESVTKLKYLVNSESNNPLKRWQMESPASIVRRLGGSEEVLKLLDSLSSDDPEAVKSEIQSCESQYLFHQELLPTETQLSVFERRIQNAKKSLKEKIGSRYSNITKGMLFKKVDELEFALPMTKDRYRSNFETLLKQRINEEESKFSEYVAEEDKGPILAFFADYVHKGKNLPPPPAKQSDAADGEEEEETFCDSIAHSPMSDGNYTSLNAIEISYTTVTGPENSSYGTILHEIGHSLSVNLLGKSASDLSRKSHQSERKCLFEQHKEEIPAETLKLYEEMKDEDPEFDLPHTREDFADMIGMIAGMELFQGNRWCHFLKYTSENLIDSGEKLTGHPGHVHSGSIFRLLNMENLKEGRIPEVCQKYLSQVGRAPVFNANCAANPGTK
jgi:hypothetical protein